MDNSRPIRRPDNLACKTLIGLVLVVFLLTAGIALAASYRGNSNSKIFHHFGCRHYNCKACTVELKSPKEAADKGFRPCKVCKP